MRRPVSGVVTSVRRDSMKIKLESRATITSKRIAGIGRGDNVEVVYDFTRSRVVSIWLKGSPPPSEKERPDLKNKPSEEQAFISARSTLPEAFSGPFVEEQDEDEEEGAFSGPLS